MKLFFTTQDVNIRFKRPHRDAPLKGRIFKGFEVLVEEEVVGENIEGNARWFRSGEDFLWSGGLSEAVPVVPVSPPVPMPQRLPATVSTPFVDWKTEIQIKGHPEWMNKTGKGVRIAVLDCGIDTAHRDLQLCLNHNEHKDFTGDSLTVVKHGHGSRCAGIIAGNASDSQFQGVRGIASDAKIINARVNGNEAFLTGDVVKALTWLDNFEKNVDIVTMSFDLTFEDSQVAALIERMAAEGTLFIASGGDAIDELFLDGTDPLLSNVTFPGRHPDCLAIGALGRIPWTQLKDGAGATFFNDKLDFLAPALSIYSTDLSINNSYSHLPGSSFAAPFVAGLAALIIEQFPDETNPRERVLQELRNVALELDEMRFDEANYQPLIKTN